MDKKKKLSKDKFTMKGWKTVFKKKEILLSLVYMTKAPQGVLL